MDYDCIIIGAGPAGMTTALNLCREGLKVLILDKENYGGQIAKSPRVENFPTCLEISGIDLSEKLFDQIDKLGANFDLEDVSSISQIDGGFAVKTNYNSYTSKTIVIATGAKHIHINVPHEEELIGNGVYYCATCDGAFFKGQHTYVIGDANSALQYALMLAGTSSKVTICTLFDKFFGDTVLQKRVLANEKIEVFHNLNLQEFDIKDNHVTGLVFQNTQSKEIVKFETNNVFVAIGQKPDNEKFSNLVELNERGYVVTNERMETKTPGVYAVGDTRVKDVRQVITACNDGCIAASYIIKYLG